MAVVGIGFDLVDIVRAEQILARHGERALRRFLLPGESRYVTSMAHPARHLAVRLAAKEAGYKALSSLRGASSISWRDIELVRDRRGRPSLQAHGKAATVLSMLGPHRLFVSLSHTDHSAGAVVILET